jgi:hypothetical protein
VTKAYTASEVVALRSATFRVGAVAEARVDATTAPTAAPPPTSTEDAAMNLLRESMGMDLPLSDY